MWLSANTRNYPYLVYKPDKNNANAVPQRTPPGINATGMLEGLELSTNELREVSGIFDASLGERSNETSGKAIMARQQMTDVGSNVFAENFSRAIKHTGRILLDLIPNIYDTERVIRIVGEDGKIDLVSINRQVGLDMVINDVSVAAYDVTLDQGPSYTTKREEAREGMLTFLQQAPSAAPVVLDLIANAQDWPNSDKFEKRLKTLLPPPIQAMEAQESGEAPPPPPPPPPELIAAQQEMAIEQMKAQTDLRKAEMSLQEKQIELEIKRLELAAAQAAAQDQFAGLQSQINQIVAALQGQPNGHAMAAQ
jgi:hypothetical protein